MHRLPAGPRVPRADRAAGATRLAPPVHRTLRLRAHRLAVRCALLEHTTLDASQLSSPASGLQSTKSVQTD